MAMRQQGRVAFSLANYWNATTARFARRNLEVTYASARTILEHTPYPADDLDFRILQQFFGGGGENGGADLVSMTAVAEEIGIHPNTVSARVRRMSAAGFVLPLVVVPNCQRLGFASGRAFFPIPMRHRTANLAEVFSCVAGAFAVYECLDGLVVQWFARSAAELDLEAQRLQESLRASSYTWDERSDRKSSGALSHELGDLAFRILKGLFSDARRPAAELASELGVTARTVQRHASRLRSQGLLWPVPGGHAVCSTKAIAHVVVDFDDAKHAAEARPFLKESFANCLMIINDPRRLEFILWSDGLAPLWDRAQASARLLGALQVTCRPILRYAWNAGFPNWAINHLEKGNQTSEPFSFESLGR